MSELVPNITSDEIDQEKDNSRREEEIKREKPPHHED